MAIIKLHESVLWTNPKPNLRSRHSFFPYLCELDNGSILASHSIGEAFESVDGTTRLSISDDQDQSWKLLPPFYDKSKHVIQTTDYMKPTYLGNGQVVLFGYEFFRENPEDLLGNPETGGLLDDRLILMRSSDYGATWSAPEEISCRWGRHVEASSPIVVLHNGDWVTPIAEFARWDGSQSEACCGRLLRSCDQGKSWQDDTIIMRLGDHITTFEQRICQLEKSGTIVAIAWNENLQTGALLNNHYAISKDNGKTFEPALDTGIRGQASSICSIGGDRLMALHAKRRDTDQPGIYAYIVNLANGTWDIESELLIWEPSQPVLKNNQAAQIFAYLKFGQPSAIQLIDGSILTTHWCIENGQGKTIVIRLKLE
jgi:sialidase-1